MSTGPLHFSRDIFSKETDIFSKDPTRMIVESFDKRARKMDEFWLRGTLVPLNARLFHDIDENEILKEGSHIPFEEYSKPDASQQPPPCSLSLLLRRKTITKKGSAASSSVSSLLPPEFQPLPYSVIVGKGKEAKDNFGNHRLWVLASAYLPKYAEAANDKKKKSKIVSTLANAMHNACPVGAFIRLGSDGRWCRVSESVVREKIGYTFRELLGEKYKSSSKAKAAMRNQVNTIF
jgi:hypothetical protein